MTVGACALHRPVPFLAPPLNELRRGKQTQTEQVTLSRGSQRSWVLARGEDFYASAQ